MLKQFALPDLGEGLTESEVVAWRVAVGDHIELNQVIADIETAKAIVELPSPFAGTVTALHAQPGETVEVGAPLLSVDDAGPGTPAADAGPAEAGPADAAAAAPAVGPAEPVAGPAADTAEPNLVGYGASADTVAPRRRPRAGAGGAGGASASGAGASGAADTAPAGGAHEPATTPHERPRSTPPVRTLARELGIELESVRGSGEGGLITRADVEAAAEASRAGRAGGETGGGAAGGTGDGTGGGATGAATGTAPGAPSLAETRTPIRGVRKATAAAMVASAFTAPHVTEFLTIDVTATTELLTRLETRVNILAVTAKAVCIALARNPALNSRWDEAAQEIVHSPSVHLGIAAATERGLVVPNIRDAQTRDLFGLAEAIRELAARARDGLAQPSELRGGTFTITNIGVFGIDAGTPILVPGESGILALGAVRRMPWEHDGGIALRDVLTLSLSFDHRVVDGEQGSRFLADVGAILRDPARVLAMV